MKLFIGVLVTLFSLQMSGQTVIISEDFNDGFPAGWQLVDNDGLTPNSAPGVSFITDAFVMVEDYDTIGLSDSILVATSWFEDENGEAEDYLILPSLTMGSYGNYISFDARSVDAAHPNELEVRISTNGVNLWEFYEQEPIYKNQYVSSTWTNYVISLDSAVNIYNQPVFISFVHRGNDDYILALDNIEVFIDDPVGITSTEVNDRLHLYPNPSEGMFNVEAPIGSRYELYDIAGKLIVENRLKSLFVNFQNLASGTYFFKVEGFTPSKITIK